MHSHKYKLDTCWQKSSLKSPVVHTFLESKLGMGWWGYVQNILQTGSRLLKCCTLSTIWVDSKTGLLLKLRIKVLCLAARNEVTIDSCVMFLYGHEEFLIKTHRPNFCFWINFVKLLDYKTTAYTDSTWRLSVEKVNKLTAVAKKFLGRLYVLWL